MNIVIMVKEVLIQRQKSSIMNLDTMVKHIPLMDYSTLEQDIMIQSQVCSSVQTVIEENSAIHCHRTDILTAYNK